ncbi:hypothetical protein [Paludisphaera sp.]|uniref:hypothetical protein n=1 Tax=Paludisphaera sp. TaxID=2017432 RepID=UPI00301DA937
MHADELVITPREAWLVVPSVDALREVSQSHTEAKHIPLELLDHLEDIYVLDASFNGRIWTTILLSNPPEGWSGVDVDLD